MLIQSLQFFARTISRLQPAGARRRSPRSHRVAPVEQLEHRVVMTIPTSVQSIVQDNTPTLTATEVSYTVTFTQNVTGVDATDFQVVRTGSMAGGSIQVTAQSASVYSVLVSGLSGTGTVGLNLVDNRSIQGPGNEHLPGQLASDLFGTAENTTLGFLPYQSTVGSFNGDAFLDIVLTDPNSNNIRVMLGNGNGTFQTATTIPISGVSPYGVTVSDLNGDSVQDLVVTGYVNNKVVVMLGNGDGTFAVTAQYTTSRPFNSRVADINNDGNKDIVVSQVGGGFNLLLGNGDGTFVAPQTISSTGQSSNLDVADLDGDGNLDVVINDYSNNRLNIFLGNGNGTFQSAYALTGSGLVSPFGLRIGDVNGDGDLDILAASPNGINSNLGVFLGNGNGTFQAITTYATDGSGRSLELRDLNNDGYLDAVIGNDNAGVTILLGNGNGTFQSSYKYSSNLLTFSADAADFDGDGRVDLVWTALVSGQFGIRRGLPPVYVGTPYTIVPAVDLSTSALTMSETGGSITVTATLSASFSSNVTINLNYGGTATNVTDYTRSAQIIVLAGQTTGTITLTAVSDTDSEADETIEVSLGSITNGTAGTLTSGSVTILDDDVPPTVNLAFVPGTFAEAGGAAQVVATLAAPATREVTINLNFGGIAEQGLDYTTSGTQIVIAVGETTGFITLTALDDALPEIDESVIVSLGELTNVSAGDSASVTATIIDSFTLAGTWFINGRPTSIGQSQADLTFTNEFGQQAAGRILSGTQVIADGWNGMLGNLVGANRIEWSNGTVWTRTGSAPIVAESVPTLATSWSYNGLTGIVQDGINLRFTNEVGQTSSGRFLSDTQVIADNWGLTGTLIGDGQIQWSNGTAWTSQAPPSFTPPTLTESWTIGPNHLPTFILGSGATVTLVNEFGNQSRGQFVSTTQIVALDWMGLVGNISNSDHTISWSNNTQWDALDSAFSNLT